MFVVKQYPRALGGHDFFKSVENNISSKHLSIYSSKARVPRIKCRLTNIKENQKD